MSSVLPLTPGNLTSKFVSLFFFFILLPNVLRPQIVAAPGLRNKRAVVAARPFPSHWARRVVGANYIEKDEVNKAILDVDIDQSERRKWCEEAMADA